MGMFDSIKFNCPNCGEELEAQSKSGACILGVYPPTEVPLDVAYDANRHAPIECDKCHKKWYFDTTVIPRAEPVNLPIREYNGENLETL